MESLDCALSCRVRTLSNLLSRFASVGIEGGGIDEAASNAISPSLSFLRGEQIEGDRSGEEDSPLRPHFGVSLTLSLVFSFTVFSLRTLG